LVAPSNAAPPILKVAALNILPIPDPKPAPKFHAPEIKLWETPELLGPEPSRDEPGNTGALLPELPPEPPPPLPKAPPKNPEKKPPIAENIPPKNEPIALKKPPTAPQKEWLVGSAQIRGLLRQ
jgi:hypothetical protein